MVSLAKENEVVRGLIQWGQERAKVRAMILTSTRTNPNAPVDLFSDYDVILAVTDIQPFFEDRGWLEDFGKVLVVYRDPIKLNYGLEAFAYITQYEDGTKIDFILWPVEMVRRVVEDPKLPNDFDVGYAVLLDKDDLTAGLKPPTYKAYIPTPPSEASYHNVIEEFFHEATYVAKHLWRDDLIAAKYNLDYAMKFYNLRRMLEWHMEIEYRWSVKTDAYGKGLKKRVRPEIWSALEDTYARAGIEENWEAMFKTISLFRKVAVEVGEVLGYPYLHDLDRRVLEYLQKVKDLDRGAKIFS